MEATAAHAIAGTEPSMPEKKSRRKWARISLGIDAVENNMSDTRIPKDKPQCCAYLWFKI